MKLKLILLSIALLISQVSAASFQPALATVKVSVENRTGDEVDINLSGPASYKFNVQTGNSKITVEAGTYSYSYKACGGRTFTGTFNAQAGAKLSLTRCANSVTGGGQSDLHFVIVQNKSSQAVTVKLSGPQNYTVTVPANDKVRKEIARGSYGYEYTACGEKKTGRFGSDHLGTTIEIAKCDSDGAGAAGGTGGSSVKTIVLVIHNKTDATLNFTLTGPQTYRVQAPIGKTRLTLEKGRYSWTMYSNACGGYGTDSGTLNLNQSSGWTWTCD